MLEHFVNKLSTHLSQER